MRRLGHGATRLLVAAVATALAFLLLADRKITLDLDKKALAWLAEAGYDPVYGARPLKRVIQREIGDRASVLILEGKVGEDSAIVVDAIDDQIVLSS